MKDFFPNNIILDDYYYNLPKERIAQYPLSDRSSSKLLVAYLDHQNKNLHNNLHNNHLSENLVVNNSDISIYHKTFSDLPDLIPDDSIMFLNDTKVIPARLLFRKPTGGLVEIFCLEPVFPSSDPMIALQSEKRTIWNCLFSGRNIKEGTTLHIASENMTTDLKALVLKKVGKNMLVEFSWENSNEKFITIINKIGNIPLPPYINRDSDESDYETYQTVYANYDGSVASPTAGLHFTEDIFNKLTRKNIKIETLTLHIGLGTFNPIETQNISEHNMHSEIISVNLNTLNSILNFFSNNMNKKFIAVGTTSLRTLETLYWLGVKVKLNIKFKNHIDTLLLNQYEPYYYHKTYDLPDVREAFKLLFDYTENELKAQSIVGRTELFIVPGYDFKVVDTLITNFHMPGSTLIFLVAAFIGQENYRRIYQEALNEKYRFLSYGDSSILFR